MKILYISRSYSPHDFRFLSAMLEGGHKPYFLSLTPVETESRSIPLEVQRVSWQGDLSWILVEVKPDLVHAGPLPDCAYLAARAGFHPLVTMSWGSDILWQARRNPFSRLKVRYALRKADVAIGDCSTVRKEISNYGVSDKHIITFPWGVDLRRFSPGEDDGGLRSRLGWRDNFVLLHLRSWETLYDPLTLARRLRSRRPPAPQLALADTRRRKPGA